MTLSIPDVVLNNGVRMPQLGCGVFKIPDEQCADVVRAALDIGYRSIDTASLYGNERAVGRAVAGSGIPRQDLFVTTKLWNSDQGYESTFRAFETSLSALGLDFVDLYLIHWPKPAQDQYIDTWRALEQLYADGRVRAIGVSNFQVAHLEKLLLETHVVPTVNQIELHPRFQQSELRGFHAASGIQTVAWSPLGQGHALTDPLVTDLAIRHERTAAQVVLRWHIQLGNVAIPKSVTPTRMQHNFEVWDFELSVAEMASLGELEAGNRLGPDPDDRDRTRKAGFSSAGGRWVAE